MNYIIKRFQYSNGKTATHTSGHIPCNVIFFSLESTNHPLARSALSFLTRSTGKTAVISGEELVDSVSVAVVSVDIVVSIFSTTFSIFNSS